MQFFLGFMVTKINCLDNGERYEASIVSSYTESNICDFAQGFVKSLCTPIPLTS
jgi:hypothetical protein